MDDSPDFFIVGAPKCGTTSLVSYLREHPSLAISRPKEPNFFCDDLPYIRQTHSLDEYLSIFEQKVAETDKRGEASTMYLFSKVAVKNVHAFRPNSKIIVMVRNPIELVQSLHSQFVYNLMEKETVFRKAWIARGDSSRLPILNYENIAMLGHQVKRLFLEFPAEQVKIVVFDDFKNNTEKVHLEILKFLEVDSIRLGNYSRHNKNKVNRSPFLAKLVRSKNPIILQQVFRLKRWLGVSELGISRRIDVRNTKMTQRPSLDEDIHSEMVSAFENDISLLGEILQRDFSEWTRRLPKA